MILEMNRSAERRRTAGIRTYAERVPKVKDTKNLAEKTKRVCQRGHIAKVVDFMMKYPEAAAEIAGDIDCGTIGASIQTNTVRAMVAEGVDSSKGLYQLCDRAGIELPIMGEVYKILFEDKDPRQAVQDLLHRDAHEEWKQY